MEVTAGTRNARGRASGLRRLPGSADSIGARLDASRGLGKGFDFLRVALAVAVVFTHSFEAVGAQDGEPATVAFMNYWVLAVFFGLSGFLITGSALRLRLRDFIINRAMRIVPALFVDVMFSALILGPIFTTLTLGEYFSSPEVYRYFLNTIGYIHFYLPEVFTTHPEPKVNISLWTVPFEIGCYVIMSLFILSGALKRASIPIIAAFGFMIGSLALEHFELISYGDALSAGAVQVALTYGGRLLASFVLGIVAFQYRYRLPYSWKLFALSLLWLGCINFRLIPGELLYRTSVLNVIAIPPLIYMMAFVGVSSLPPLPLFRRGDYSYGIYLYGMPVQQACYALLPAARSPWSHFIIVMPVIVLFAMFSWHVIEKPLLAFRKRFSFVARQRLAASEPIAALAGAEHDKPLPPGAGSA